MKNTQSSDAQKVILEFDNQSAAEHFKLWLCESGEQDYWLWMEHKEQEDDGPITGVEFKYHENGKFGEGPIIVNCGRLTK